MSENRQPNRRITPQSDLDLSFMTTDSVWGKNEVSEELRERLNKALTTVDADGNTGTTIDSLWGLLGFYTRDLRLANLNSQELKHCQYYLELASDLLLAGFPESFMICISRVAGVTELSQSKNGFLRKNNNTFRTEQMQGDIEPPKKDLFGGKSKQRGL